MSIGGPAPSGSEDQHTHTGTRIHSRERSSQPVRSVDAKSGTTCTATRTHTHTRVCARIYDVLFCSRDPNGLCCTVRVCARTLLPVQELVSKTSAKMTVDGMSDLISHTTMFRDEKRVAEERIATAKANKTNVIANQRANKKKSIKKKKVRFLSLLRRFVVVICVAVRREPHPCVVEA